MPSMSIKHYKVLLDRRTLLSTNLWTGIKHKIPVHILLLKVWRSTY